MVNPGFRDYHLPSFADVPRTEVYFADTSDTLGPMGAKSMSESPYNPVAAALGNALADATGIRFTVDAVQAGPAVSAAEGEVRVRIDPSSYPVACRAWHSACIALGRRSEAPEPARGGPLSMSTEIHPVDQILPVPRLLALGLQHVLVMYAGAVAVPLIIGRALKLSPEDVAFLISADLFACGLATLVQCSASRASVFGCL